MSGSTMCLLLLLSALMVLSTAEPLCDPLTQYEDNGVCCKMCAPGTKMNVNECNSPICEPCAQDEYHDTYNKEEKCKLQPYCDPNKNFEAPDHHKEKRTICTCKQGFHCSGESCSSCVPHKLCGPGEEVLQKGNTTKDTVCQPCPEGTFSNDTSMEKSCVEHTKCSLGFSAEQPGTDRSDTVCVANKRVHVALGTGLAIFLLALIGGVVLYCRKNSSFENGKKMVNVCVECIGPTGEVPKYEIEEETKTPMMERTPVETEDSSIPSGCSLEIGRSENGKVVCPVEEEGKYECLSRQESQISASSTVNYS
uniref:CD40 molecule, TNF receptor superfamily member 5 n=1 Tax=Fundulus heteroclitus TaxID=8078 RepID=A0A3Q2ST21_FUNHE